MKCKLPKNPNYCATIAKVTNIIPLDNCDNIVAAIVLSSQVIVQKSTKIGDVGVFFPIECKLSNEYLFNNNLYRHKELNIDNTKKGYIEDNGRLKTARFKGHKSEGLFMPIESLQFASGIEQFQIGAEFDELNNIPICEKYIVVKNNLPSQGKKGKSSFKNVSRMIDGQFHLHPDTKHLKRNLSLLNPESIISISKKMHGTSAVFGNILVNRKLNILEKMLKKVGVKIQEKEYDLVYSSRKVIKNEFYPNKNSFYSENVWQLWADKLKDIIPKNFTLYGEIVGYLPSNKMIQNYFHYGQKPGTSEFYVYKITYTNEDGLVTELNRNAIDDFCKRYGLKSTPLYYYGYASDLYYPKLDCFNFKDINDWRNEFIKKLEKDESFDMNDSMDCMCNWEVPSEGVVLRIENIFDMKPLKLKNYEFEIFEGKQKDKGEVDIEEEN